MSQMLLKHQQMQPKSLRMLHSCHKNWYILIVGLVCKVNFHPFSVCNILVSSIIQGTMKFCLVYIAVLSNLAILSSSITCENQFSASFIAIIDQTLDSPNLLVDDPDLTFFRDVMKFDDDEIELVTEKAIQFFKDVYGLDFSLSKSKRTKSKGSLKMPQWLHL